MKPLDVRDMYAMAALQGAVANACNGFDTEYLLAEDGERMKLYANDLARFSFAIADAMMATREQTSKEPT